MRNIIWGLWVGYHFFMIQILMHQFDAGKNKYYDYIY